MDLNCTNHHCSRDDVSSPVPETPNPVGRPSSYLPEYCDKVDEYLETRQDEEYDWTKSESSGKVDSESWEHRIKVRIPTMDGFARFIGVPRRTLFDWKDEHEEFSHSLEKILIEQKERLISYGLSGDYNPTIAKLILASNHDMRDKVDTDVTSKGKSIGGFNFIRNDGDNNTDNKTD